MILDLEETFASLRQVDLRLNPEKYVFGVPSGKLLGFLVSHRGIEANPEKVKGIEDMSPPQTLREMQKLVGCMTSLGRFISKLGERALPFFKLMKKKGPFEWTPEANQVFQDLKRYLTSPPVMVAPRCRCQNWRISGRGYRTVRLRSMLTGDRGYNVYPGSGPVYGGNTLLPA